MDIKLQIEDIIEQNGSDFEISKLFKAYIKEYKDSLPKLFESSQGKDFLVKHTKKLDSIIHLMYTTVLRRNFGNYLPMRSSIPIAIVALGSYGREQLCVYSDIDILISYENVDGYNTQLIIEKLFYLALDSGLKLGHRVHETSDLFTASNEDITIKTSLMEARLITGSPFTWHETQRQLNSIRSHQQKEFILAKIEEAQIRRKKYPASMQPNIKEGVGGLRDSHLLFWVAQNIYGVSSLKDLSGDLFTDAEYKEYRVALELLYRVRSALHLIRGKQEDKLLLEFMPQITTMLGFQDTKKMATKVLQALWRINNFTQIFVKKMVHPFIADMSYVTKFRHNRITKGIYLLEDRLYASFKLPIQPIESLLAILVALPDKQYKFDAGFLNQFTYTTIKHPLSNNIYTYQKELLKKKNVACFLKLFYDAGILHELFSNFKKVLHLPQFDGYHHYPVDLHSIKCVEALENIKDTYIQNLFDSFTQEEQLVLKIVVFTHDTGKGRKKDHSEIGAKLVVQFCQNLHIEEDLIKRAITLVRYHVLMSGVAFKENIHNEKTLYRFMSRVGDTKNLKLLYVLTYADINGVGGNVYNDFNSKLIYSLFRASLDISENSDRITDAKKRIGIEKRVKNKPEFKELSSIMRKKILRIESNLFFFKHSPNDIVSIAKLAKETNEYQYRFDSTKSLTVEIFRKVPFNIGYLLSSLPNLDVGSMEIFTLFDEVKYFKIEFLQHLEQEGFIELENIITDAFDMEMEIKLNNITLSDECITIDCDHSLTHAEIAVNTSNQKGLLAFIMAKFEKLNINVITAKIHSSKHKVRDSFLIEKQNNICDNTEQIYKLLTKGEV